MPDSDLRSARPGDIGEAIALLTRLPASAPARRRGAAAAWAYPIAGLAVGAIAGLAGLVAGGMGLTPGLAAAAALLAMVLITGALHEDGLADSADGLGGWNRARRLEIMADSRIGTYGVTALVLSLLIRWSALTTLAATGQMFWSLVAVATLARAPMVAAMALMPNARGRGLSASIGVPVAGVAQAALGLGLAGALLAAGWPGLMAALAALFAATLVAVVAQTRIGGQTGDILGAIEQAGEMAALVTLAAAAS